MINLKDIVKSGIQERFQQLRSMGIKTVMITGDNPLTAAAIAAEAQVDDFLAQAKPEDKLRLIREYQEAGFMVAMTGDGTNDAPALAQADVAVAMNTGTQPAREAANIIDLDSNPTKLLDIVEIGKQILMTRGNLTTFSISNDIAKYFAIIPAALLSIYPQLGVLNVMHLASPYSAILSAVIFNALIIPMLVPLALKGTKFRAMPAEKLLIHNLLIYGVGGIIAPFVGIKAIDLVLGLLRLIRQLKQSEEFQAHERHKTRHSDVHALHRYLRRHLSGRGHRPGPGLLFPDQADGQSHHRPERQGDRLGSDRPALLRARNTSGRVLRPPPISPTTHWPPAAPTPGRPIPPT